MLPHDTIKIPAVQKEYYKSEVKDNKTQTSKTNNFWLCIVRHYQ